MGINVTKIVLNKNYFKSVLLTNPNTTFAGVLPTGKAIGCCFFILNFPPITSSYCNCVLKKAFMLSCEITVPLS